ncbi:hypothetical protein VTK26DRAFT_8525 [Humicola hyalothermophila]
MMNTATVGLAVTPTVISTLLTHYLNRKPQAHKPTAHLSYNEGLHLIRAFLAYASHHTVEELQAFTSQWVPNPRWVRVDNVEIPEHHLARAADLLADQLGPDGIRQVGGRRWWQWRGGEPDGGKNPLRAEWIEMRADYHERKKKGDPGSRVMLYVHGGAYYFGSVDEHRYQIQRHARKLKARALAPRYRLAPQFPFPCGLQDCLATYLYLITHQKPETIVLAGDSAGAGMVLSVMVILRDRGIPLPAGAVLISPWVDLTHSFPSVAGDCPLDYIPPSGFHHKPSRAWPPPDETELEALKKIVMQQKRDIEAQDGTPDRKEDVPSNKDVAERTHRLTVLVDGQQVEVTEQIQMYTTNELLVHPLVSPIMQPTLGGLPPLLIMVGGGELLRDEQIYLAHKCADPAAYLPPERLMDEQARATVDRYPPTDVQLQVWDDLCHVAPTLSWTRPAKYMYRSVAQFSAWALARAQKTRIDVLTDDRISIISSSSTSSTSSSSTFSSSSPPNKTTTTTIGRAGSPLPPFTDHMIRQRVTRHGTVLPLPPPSELPGCAMPRELVGVVKAGTVRKWLEHRARWDARFAGAKRRVREERAREAMAMAGTRTRTEMGTDADGGDEGEEGSGRGFGVFGEGEVPPPSAMAGWQAAVVGRREEREYGWKGRRVRVRGKVGRSRREKKEGEKRKKKKKGVGLALWGLWGSKHDEVAVKREEMVGGGGAGAGGAAAAGQGIGVASPEQGQGARRFSDLQRQEGLAATGEEAGGAEKKAKEWRAGLAGDGEKEKQLGMAETSKGKEGGEHGLDLRPAGPVADRPDKEEGELEERKGQKTMGFLSPDDAHATGVTGKRVILGGVAMPFSLRKEAETASMITLATPMDQGSTRPSTAGSGGSVVADGQAKAGDCDGGSQTVTSPLLSPVSPGGGSGLERFVTAEEEPSKASP